MNSADRVTITINTKDREKFLAITLASLLSQTFSKWDLILLDASKTPVINGEEINGLLTLFKKYGHAVTYETDMSIGIPQTYQRGLELTKTKYGMRSEDDVWFEPEALQRAYEVIESDEKCGAVGFMTPNFSYRVLNDPPPNELRNGFVMKPSSLAPNMGLIHEPVDQQSMICKQDKTWEVCTLHAGSIYRADAARSIGGFCSHFSPTGHREETLFYCRLYFAGWSLKVRSWARLWHFEGSTGGSRPEGALADTRQNNRRSDESTFQGELRALIARYPDRRISIFEEGAPTG